MSGPRSPLTVSVVIITAGRRQCIPPCIESLRRQTYRPLEIVVVPGPSKDGTDNYVRTLTDAKVCPVGKLNVSHARNEGIRRSGGDIIAFIDDDAVAHPRWVAEMVEVFEREGPDCGGVGGYVINENENGRPIQALNNTINDLGEPDQVRSSPAGYNDPDGSEFNYFMGANMAFRREAILAAGGCDETYTYHFEDADLSVAVIQAGYRILHHTRALVHHFPAKSHNRRGTFDLNFFAIARHQLYFSLKFSKQPEKHCFWGVARTKIDWLRMYRHLVWNGRMTPWAAIRHTINAARGLADGLEHGRRVRTEGRVPALPVDLPKPEFKPIDAPEAPAPARSKSPTKPLRVALICGEFGGPVFGGVGGYTQHLAEALGSRGLDVTVLRAPGTACRIRPEGYRIEEVQLYHPHPAAYRAAFLKKLRLLADRKEFDIVEAPLWNGEGAAVGAAARWPLVIRLQTPFELTRQISDIEMDPGHAALIASERLQLAYASGIIGISRAVVGTVEDAYEIPMEFHGRRLAVIPLGMPGAGRLSRRPVDAPEFGGTRYLYCGRLEARKGILELGRAFAQVAARDPKASLWIVGADNSVHDSFKARTGGTYRQALEAMWGPEVTNRVTFFGRLADEEKNELYARCDVLVAPSRYESFGLIFLEAMRYGKPTIGTEVGGVPEVVDAGRTGLLVPSESVERLSEAMLTLGSRPDLRREMGAAGLRRFDEMFSLYSLARQTENFYRQILEDWHGRSFGAPRPGGPVVDGIANRRTSARRQAA